MTISDAGSRWSYGHKTLNRKQIDLIRFSKELSSAVTENLSDPTLAAKAAEDLSNDDYDSDLHSACVDALMNEAPEVHAFIGRGSYGDFPILVRGIPGIYFVEAMEFDDRGPFETLGKARDYAASDFADFIAAANEEAEE